MKYLEKIFNVWDNNAEAMGKAIGEQGVKVRQWRHRKSIPVGYWNKIITAAAALGAILEYGDFMEKPSSEGVQPYNPKQQRDDPIVTCLLCEKNVKDVDCCAIEGCPRV